MILRAIGRTVIVFGLAWCGMAGYWYARNLIHTGNPLPWINEIGPIELPGPDRGLEGRDPYSIAQHARTARDAGLGLDEVSRARAFRSADEKEAALLTFLEAVLATDGRPSAHLGEEAREAGWSDEQLLEAVADVALNEFQSLISNAAALPRLRLLGRAAWWPSTASAAIPIAESRAVVVKRLTSK